MPRRSFAKGNKCAAAENMSAEAHARRMEGLRKKWAVMERMRRGERIVTSRSQKKNKHRRRLTMQITQAKELREIQDLARQYTEQSIKAVGQIFDDDLARPSDIIAAAEFLNNRAYGKPAQVNVNASVDANAHVEDASDQELNQRIDEALKRVESVAGRSTKEEKREERSADLRKLN